MQCSVMSIWLEEKEEKKGFWAGVAEKMMCLRMRGLNRVSVGGGRIESYANQPVQIAG